MKRSLLWLVLLLTLALAATGCQKDNNADDDASPAGDDDAADDDGATADDDAADDDADDDATPPEAQEFRFDLSWETQFTASLVLRQYADNTLEGRFVPAQGFDVIKANTPLDGTGTLLMFPETFGRMITLKMQGPALNREPCNDQPISYSLTLTAKENNGYMIGSVAAYCGADNYSGRVARVMRISGLQELVR